MTAMNGGTMKLAWTLVLALGAGCGGTVCEDAADVIADCDLPETEPTDPPPEGEEPMCEGDGARRAQCVVDHPDEACAAIEGIVRGEFIENSYTECVNGG
jgi:hypothetical protein